MEYMLRRRPFDESLLSGSVRAIERIVDEDEAVSAVADALRDFGLADDEDGSEFLILAQADNRARTIGPWLVNTVQAAGWDGEFVLEFIVEDETGDPTRTAASGWPTATPSTTTPTTRTRSTATR